MGWTFTPPCLESPNLCKVSSQSHFASFPQWSQQAGVAEEQLDGSLGDGLSAVIDKVHTLEVSEVVSHYSGDETLQLLHVQGARDVWLIRTGQRSGENTQLGDTG